MKRLQKLSYIALGAILALTLNFTVPAFAASVDSAVKTLTAYFTVGGNPISIFVDGEKITPKDGNGKVVEPFVVDGTTYLPVRAVSEALGKTVSWDGTTASVYIGVKPGETQYMTDICPAYESGGTYDEYSALKSGGSQNFSISGKKYTNGFTFNRNGWAVYNLNGQFVSFEATFGHVDGAETFAGEGTGFRIYCDGVLKKEIPIAGDMYATNISLDVTGVNQLKIITIEEDNRTKNMAGSFFTGLYGFADPVLK